MKNLSLEVQKTKLAAEYGTDVIMDLSTGPNPNEFRTKIMNPVLVPIETLPIYEAGVSTQKRKNLTSDMIEEDMFKVIEN